MVSVIQEVLSSIRVVKAFAQEEYEQRRLEEESLESVEIALRARGLKARLSPIVEMIVAVGTCLVLWFGGRMVLNGALGSGSLVLFIWYLGKMYKPMQELSKMTDAYSKAAVGYERIREVLETDGELKDRPGARRAPSFRGKIEFDHVSFSYDQQSAVLRDVSFTVEPGQVAALVGPTGAGKTTIISLIPRFYDPDSGAVKIDGTDIRAFRQASLRRQMSFVLQETAPVPRADLVQHRLRQARREPRRNPARRGARQRQRIHRAYAAGLRYHGGRARRYSLRRPAPAHRHCPRRDSQDPHPDPG